MTSALVAASPAAWGQSKAAADVLFDEGKALMAEKRYADACPKFAASQKIDPAPGTLVWLADCYEQNGQTASAWSTYREALAAAKAARQPAREALATERIAALQKVLSRIIVKVGADRPTDLAITIDGVTVASTLWDTATPFDPGAHTVEATAAGHVTFTHRLELAKATSETVVIPPLVKREAPPPAASSSAPVASSAPPPPPVSAPSTANLEPPKAARSNVGLVVGAVGAAGLVAGVVLQLGARSLAREAIDDCRAHTRCTDADLDKHDRASSRQTVAWLVGGVGAGLLVTGAVWTWSSPGASGSGRTSITPSVGLGSGGVALRRTW